MSDARLNIDTGEWEFSFDELSNSISIGFFSDQSQDVTFSGLRFGWNLTTDLVEVLSKEYPESPEISYVSSDQEYISTDTFEVEEEKPYRLLVWAENNGQEHSAYVDWVAPKIEVPPATVEEENVGTDTGPSSES